MAKEKLTLRVSLLKVDEDQLVLRNLLPHLRCQVLSFIGILIRPCQQPPASDQSAAATPKRARRSKEGRERERTSGVSAAVGEPGLVCPPCEGAKPESTEGRRAGFFSSAFSTCSALGKRSAWIGDFLTATMAAGGGGSSD
jgi:hypothetical protein